MKTPEEVLFPRRPRRRLGRHHHHNHRHNLPRPHPRRRLGRHHHHNRRLGRHRHHNRRKGEATCNQHPSRLKARGPLGYSHQAGLLCYTILCNFKRTHYRFIQVTLHRGLPFSVGIPNAETIKALRQDRTGEELIEYDDLDALKAKHD